MAIQFDEENFQSFTSSRSVPVDQGKTGSKMGDWLIRVGVAKDVQSANLIMIIGSLAMIAISIYIFIYGFSLPEFGSSTPAPTPFDPTQIPGLEN